MKRIISILLSVLMLAGMIVPSLAYAEELPVIRFDEADLQMEVTVSQAKVVPGGTVTVSVTATKNNGFILFSAEPDFNGELLTQVGNVTYGAIGSGTAGQAALIDAGNSNITDTGLLFSYTLQVKDDAAVDSVLTLGVKNVEAYNLEEEELDTCATTANVTVVACLHTDTVNVPAAASTCTTPGHAAYVACADCGQVMSGDATPLALSPDNHEGEGTHQVGAVLPTATTEGYTGDTVCNGCGTLLAQGEVIPATAALEILLEADAESAVPGGTLTVTATLTKNLGFQVFSVTPDYDADLLI